MRFLGILQEICPSETFNKKVKQPNAKYQLISQSFPTPIQFDKTISGVWEANLNSYDWEAATNSAKPYHYMLYASTRKQLFETTRDYVSANLFSLYTNGKEEYLTDRNMILGANCIKPKLNFWWTSFVKSEVDLTKVFTS